MTAFPQVAPGEPVSVSATLYRTYARCPQQALARTRGIYPAESVPAFRGTLAHRVFARHLTGGAIPEERLARVCREEIGAGPWMNEKMATLGLDRPSRLEAVVQEVATLYSRFRSLPTAGFREAEVPLEVEVAPGVVLKGQVDAVFDDPHLGTRLVDWKTGGIDEGTGLQLAFYLLVWELDRGETPGGAEAISLADGERLVVPAEPPRLAATATAVAALVTALRHAWAVDGELERRGGPHCRFCPLLEECAEGRAAARILGG
jgi:RecB family exonuclease